MEDGFDSSRHSPVIPGEAGSLSGKSGAENPSEAVPVPFGTGGRQPEEEIAAFDRYSLFEQTRRGARVGRLGIALAPGTLYEVVESAHITPLPGVKPLFKGFVTHRSNVAPVYDLAELIDDDRPPWERKRLLILNSGREAVAVLLYELPFQIRGEAIEPDPVDDIPDIFRRHTHEAYRSHGTLWLALDYEGFFTELSTLCLETGLETGPETQAPGSVGIEPPTFTLEY